MSASQSNTSQSNRSRILQAAVIVGVAFVVSRLLGVVRDAVINFYFDIDSLEANAYLIASRFPETIFYIIAGGALGSAFIPTFSAYFTRDDSAGGWRLFAAVANLITVITMIVAGMTALLAPQIITLFYRDLMRSEPELLDMTVILLRVMLLSPIIFGISGVIMAALNARQHFLLPAVAPIIYNLGIIVGALVFAPNVLGLAVGTVAGSLGHLLIQLPALRRQKAGYVFIFSIRDPGVVQVLRLMAPRVLGLSFGQLNHLVMQFLAQSMIIGSIPALTYGWRIMVMPQGIIGQALGIAAFPTFSTLAAEQAIDEMRRILAGTLRLILFLSLPAMVLMVVLRLPLISLLFERGEFDAESTTYVAWALLFLAPSLAGLAAIEIISRAFYALKDTWTPVLVGGFQLAMMIGLGLWLGYLVFPGFGWLALGGLALAYSISTYLETAVLLWLLRRKMAGIGGHQLLDGLWRMGLAGGLMLVVCWLAGLQLDSTGVLLQISVASLIGGLAYLVASWLLGVVEVRQFLEYGRQMFGRRSR
jgi:putative peptidoglycan lipid II flippase